MGTIVSSSAVLQSLGNQSSSVAGNVFPQQSVSAPTNGLSAEAAVSATGSSVVTSEQARNAVATANRVVQIYNENIEFSVDDTTGIHVVRVLDRTSGDLIRQLPIQAVLDFSRTLDKLQGLLFNQAT